MHLPALTPAKLRTKEDRFFCLCMEMKRAFSSDIL